MNHDPKYNEFEYEKENYPKTPEHFKQFVAAQVTKELSKASIVKHRARKKYFPAKVAAAVIVCAAVGTTGAYAGVKQYQARSHCSGNFFRRRNSCYFRQHRFRITSYHCI